MHNANAHLYSQFLHAIAQCQQALYQDMNNPLKWIHWVDDVGYEKVAIIKLVLVTAEKALPNENKLNTYILIKKHNWLGKNSIVTCLSNGQTSKTQDKFEYNNTLLS